MPHTIPGPSGWIIPGPSDHPAGRAGIISTRIIPDLVPWSGCPEVILGPYTLFQEVLLEVLGIYDMSHESAVL